MEQKGAKILVGCGLFLGGLAIGAFLGHTYPGQPKVSDLFKTIRLPDPDHRMISPLLLSGISVQGDTEEFKNIENKLKLLTYDALNLPGVDTISVYFKDLNSALWAGIGEKTGYDPASLLKVPILMAWLKKEQEHPGTLSRMLVWKGSPNDEQGIDFFTLRAGQSYSVDQLLTVMIKKSDNDAKNLLLENLGPKDLDSVFTDLSIAGWKDSKGNPNKISPATYSRFLRVLYNSTYLDRDLSEKALELLASSDFKDGIVAGTPSNVAVSHKFGQYTYDDPSSTLDPVELHDCGIVYYPQKPYLLCIMTEGKTDLATLESIIKNISSTIYTAVDTGD